MKGCYMVDLGWIRGKGCRRKGGVWGGVSERWKKREKEEERMKGGKGEREVEEREEDGRGGQLLGRRGGRGRGKSAWCRPTA